MTKNQNKGSKNDKGKRLYKKWVGFHKSKDEVKAIVSFALITLLLVSSVALAASSSNVYSQASEEANPTEIEPEIDTVEEASNDESSSEEASNDESSSEEASNDESSSEEEDNQPNNIEDVIQEEPTTEPTKDVVEDNFNVDDIQLEEPAQLQVDDTGNTTIPQDVDNTIPLLEQETAHSLGNMTQENVVLGPTKNTVLQQVNQTTPRNSTDINMTLSSAESNKGNFVVNVKVTNNSPNKDQGRINVRIDGSDESNTVSTQFPAKKTITKTFLFKGSEVPVGKGFTVEIVPEKSNSVTGQGVNSPAQKPEEVRLTIGHSSAGLGKFRVVVKVTNTAATEYEGGVYVNIDDGPSQAQYDITFPAKSTIQRIFEFDSKVVPVGKGFIAEARWDDDYNTTMNGVNSPKKGPELVKIRIP